MGTFVIFCHFTDEKGQLTEQATRDLTDNLNNH